MIYKNKRIEYILLTILIVGLILIFGSFFKQLNFADNSQQVKKGERVEIIAGDTLKQKFTSEHDGLSNLKILFGNKILRDGHFLKFILADEKCEESIVEKVLVGEYEFNSKYLYDFNFPKIDDSENKKYCLKISLEEELEWGLLRKVKSKFKKNKEREKQKIRLFEQNDSSDNIEKYVIINKSGDKKMEGERGVSFRQSYKNQTVRQDFQQLNQRMSQYKPWFLKEGYLAVIAVLVIAFTGWSLAMLTEKREKEEK